MILETWHLEFIKIRTVDLQPRKPFAHVYNFVASGHGIQEDLESAQKLMSELGVNHAFLIKFSGILAFSENPLDLDPLVVKLVSGLGFLGPLSGCEDACCQVNQHQGRFL